MSLGPSGTLAASAPQVPGSRSRGEAGDALLWQKQTVFRAKSPHGSALSAPTGTRESGGLPPGDATRLRDTCQPRANPLCPKGQAGSRIAEPRRRRGTKSGKSHGIGTGRRSNSAVVSGLQLCIHGISFVTSLPLPVGGVFKASSIA